MYDTDQIVRLANKDQIGTADPRDTNPGRSRTVTTTAAAGAVAPWADHVNRARPSHYLPTRDRDENARNAAHDALAILADGMWHNNRELGGIAKKHRASVPGMLSVMDEFGLAESDSGRYLCIPRPWTPELAPDGT